MQPSIDKKKLIALWSVVVVAYVLLVVLMNPVWMVGDVRQREVFEVYAANRCEAEAAASAGADLVPHIEALGRSAETLGMTQRTVLLIVEHQQDGQGWDPSICQ